MALAGVLLAWVVLAVSLGDTVVRSATRSVRATGWLRAVGVALGLAGVFSVAWYLRRTGLPPRHVMYLDEPWYLTAARALRHTGRAALCTSVWGVTRCAPYRKALGWPVLLALAGVPGVGADSASIRLTVLLGALAAPAVAWAARAARCSWPAALVAGLALAVHPLPWFWSATAETHVPGALLLTVGTAMLLHAMEDGTAVTVVGACAALVLATTVRGEQGVSLAVAAGVVVWGVRARRWPAVTVLVVPVALAVAGGSLAAMWGLNQEMSHGVFLALRGMGPALRQVTGFASWPAVAGTAVGAVLGTVGALRTGRGATAAVVLGVALPLLAVVLCFDRFQERMLVAPVVALLPLCAGVGNALTGVRTPIARAAGLMLTVAWLGVCGLASRRWYPTQHVPDTQVLAARFSDRVARTVHDGWLLAEWPAVYTPGVTVPVMATREALARGPAALAAEAARRPVYLARDMYCEPHYAGVERADCARLLEAFTVETVLTEDLYSHQDALVRVRGLRAQAHAPGVP